MNITANLYNSLLIMNVIGFLKWQLNNKNSFSTRMISSRSYLLTLFVYIYIFMCIPNKILLSIKLSIIALRGIRSNACLILINRKIQMDLFAIVYTCISHVFICTMCMMSMLTWLDTLILFLKFLKFVFIFSAGFNWN